MEKKVPNGILKKHSSVGDGDWELVDHEGLNGYQNGDSDQHSPNGYSPAEKEHKHKHRHKHRHIHKLRNDLAERSSRSATESELAAACDLPVKKHKHPHLHRHHHEGVERSAQSAAELGQVKF